MSKSIDFTGIIRNLPAISVPDGSMYDVINLRPKDGSWRPVGEKSHEAQYGLTDIKHIHRINADLVVYIGQSASGKVNHYHVYAGEIPSVVTVTNITCTAETRFSSWHNVLLISDGANEVMSVLIFKVDTNTYEIYDGAQGSSLLPDLPEITFERTAGVDDSDTFEATADTLLDAQVAEYMKMFHDKADRGYLVGSLLFRYAWELADGSIVKHSMPDKLFTSEISVSYVNTTITTSFKGIHMNYTIVCDSAWLTSIQNKYKNIISGLNVYVSLHKSPEIKEKTVTPWFTFGGSPRYDVKRLSYYTPDIDTEQYFLLKHIPLSELVANTSTRLVKDDESLLDLPTRIQMPINNNSHHAIFGRRLFAYNDRFFCSDIKNYLFKGYDLSKIISPGDSNTVGAAYKVGIVFSLSVSNRETVNIFTGWYTFNHYNSTSSLPEFWIKRNASVTLAHDPLTLSDAEKRSSYWGYPDSRCKRALVYITTDDGLTAYLAGAYNFTSNQERNLSYYKTVKISVVIVVPVTWSILYPNLDNFYYDDNRIQAFEINNPFYYPPVNSYRVQGKVLGLSSNAMALSQGQFGQHPIFAFSSEGIWAMSIGSGDVLINTITPLSREVCNNPDSSLPVDGGTIFTTARGLHVGSGSQVIELSAPAEGSYLSPLSGFGNYSKMLNNPNLYEVGSLQCSVSFIGYISSARMAWNYKEKEIIVSNPNYDYSWVYSIEHKAWYKIGKSFLQFVADYPVVYGMTMEGSVYTRHNMTVESFPDLVTVHAETRPIKLTAAHAYKKLLRLLVSGWINNNSDYPFSVTVWGSNDMVSWFPVMTGTFSQQNEMLLGRPGYSCKYYIVIIGGKVDAQSYFMGFNVTWEDRYHNKLRG